MFETVGDVVAGAVAIVAVGYLAFAIQRKRKQLGELFNVIDADDAVMYGQLEEMVASGLLIPYHRARTATA